MGTVYLAEDTELTRTVALKVPHPAAVESPEMRERFKREARAVAALSHPNLCPVHDVGEIEGTPYFVMAYVEGSPLSEVLAEFHKTGRPLPQDWCASVVSKVARALQEAHGHSIVHRDLKPANIMMKKGPGKKLKDEPVVMDFGLARQVKDDRLTGSGVVMGTLPYMPPEAFLNPGAETGPGGDIYTLGVILFELLTGRLPFEAPGMAVAVQIASEIPSPAPTSLRADLDPRLEAVCLKAMAKKPEERYATMADFAAALVECRRGPVDSGPTPRVKSRPAKEEPASNPFVEITAPVDQSTKSSPYPAPRSDRRGPLSRRLVLAAGGAAAVFLVFAGFYFYFKYTTREGPSVGFGFGTPPDQDKPVHPPVNPEKDPTRNAMRGTRWEGIYKQYRVGELEPHYSKDLLRIIKSREEDKIEFEDRLDNREHVVLIRGPIDKEGNVHGTVVHILKGFKGMEDTVRGQEGDRGRIDGETWNTDVTKGTARHVVILKLMK
jgi:serine/threonine protein kinase